MSNRYRWHAPLDPDCPTVRNWREAEANDPISQQCGCMDEITDAWEERHRARCERCQAYGAANVEVTD